MGWDPPITPKLSFLGGQQAECVRYGQKGFTYEFEVVHAFLSTKKNMIEPN